MELQNQGLVPGAYVRHPAQPDWGLGQVQSVAGGRITVNFENCGKVVIMKDRVGLEIVHPQAEQKP